MMTAIEGEVGLMLKSTYNFTFKPSIFLGERMRQTSCRYFEGIEHNRIVGGFKQGVAHPEMFAVCHGHLFHRIETKPVAGGCCMDITSNWNDKDACMYNTNDASIIHDKLANAIFEVAEVPRTGTCRLSGWQVITRTSIPGTYDQKAFMVSRKSE